MKWRQRSALLGATFSLSSSGGEATNLSLVQAVQEEGGLGRLRNDDRVEIDPFTARPGEGAPKVSSNADTVCQPTSANNPTAGYSTSWFPPQAWGMA